MSATRRATARPPTLGLRSRALALITLAPIAATLLVHAASAADPPPAARRLDAAEARRAGVALQLVARADLAESLVEVRPEPGSSAAGIAAAARLLDVTADGTYAATAPGIGPDVGSLVVARSDGSQLEVPVDGLLDAAFAPDASWLAVIDGAGMLWAVAAEDGATRRLADGPFVAAPLVEQDGAVLALAVSSVEAPFQSILVRVSPDGSVARISDEDLVYGTRELADGSLAVIAHRPSGTIVQRLADRRASPHADLGPDAVNVSVSEDGRVIAWQRRGEAIVRVGDEPPRAIGTGSVRAVAPDGSAVLLQRDSDLVLLGLDGTRIATFASQAGFARCGGCQP